MAVYVAPICHRASAHPFCSRSSPCFGVEMRCPDRSSAPNNRYRATFRASLPPIGDPAAPADDRAEVAQVAFIGSRYICHQFSSAAASDRDPAASRADERHQCVVIIRSMRCHRAVPSVTPHRHSTTTIYRRNQSSASCIGTVVAAYRSSFKNSGWTTRWHRWHNNIDKLVRAPPLGLCVCVRMFTVTLVLFRPTTAGAPSVTT